MLFTESLILNSGYSSRIISVSFCLAVPGSQGIDFMSISYIFIVARYVSINWYFAIIMFSLYVKCWYLRFYRKLTSDPTYNNFPVLLSYIMYIDSGFLYLRASNSFLCYSSLRASNLLLSITYLLAYHSTNLNINFSN